MTSCEDQMVVDVQRECLSLSLSLVHVKRSISAAGSKLTKVKQNVEHWDKESATADSTCIG